MRREKGSFRAEHARRRNTKLRGESAHRGLLEAVERIPADSFWPELPRARAALRLKDPDTQTD